MKKDEYAEFLISALGGGNRDELDAEDKASLRSFAAEACESSFDTALEGRMPKQRVSGLGRGHGDQVGRFGRGNIGFAILKIIGVGDTRRAEQIGRPEESSKAVLKASELAAIFDRFAPAGMKKPIFCRRTAHAEDIWFGTHAEALKKGVVGASSLEVLDSATPCMECREWYMEPLKALAKCPIVLFTFRDDEHKGKQCAHEVNGKHLVYRGEWKDPDQ